MGLGESIRLAKGVLRDSFDLTETPHTGPVCTSHGYKPPATRRIDYIFVSEHVSVERFEVIDNFTDTDTASSDHFPLRAEISF